MSRMLEALKTLEARKVGSKAQPFSTAQLAPARSQAATARFEQAPAGLPGVSVGVTASAAAEPAVSAALAVDPQRDVYVKGDERTQYGHVMTALVLLKDAGAARLSFLLLVPTVLGAVVLKGVKDVLLGDLPPGWKGPFVVGVLSAWGTGLLAIQWLLGYVRRHTYGLFVVYRLVVAALIVFLGDKLGVGAQLSTGVVVVLGIRIFSNAAAIRRHVFRA